MQLFTRIYHFERVFVLSENYQNTSTIWPLFHDSVVKVGVAILLLTVK